MRKDEPRKRRLVDRRGYLETLWARGWRVSFAGVLGICAVVLILWTISMAKNGADTLYIALPTLGLFGGIALALTRIAETVFAAANQIEPVELITRHNVEHLPAAETLVRGSERPPTGLQAELLRAVGPGPGTPSEELLRPIQESRPG